jgi:TolB-like protein
VDQKSPPPEQVRTQLRRILASPLFSTARRLSRFLEFVVYRSIEGQAAEIKESLIGVEVYGREATYDPKADSIVRAEASRLRAKLREYYETEGRTDEIRIELPKGSYSPLFVVTTPAQVAEPAAAPVPAIRRRVPRIWVPIAALVLLLAGAGVLWQTHAFRRRSMAIMPLANLAPDRSTDPLGDTLTEVFTRAVLSSKEWKIAGRAPSLDLSGRNQMLTPLRQNLRADLVLTGSYQVTDHADVRLTLQVVNVADGYLLWTQTYHRRLAELAEAQNELARGVVAEFTQALTGRRSGATTKAYEQAREAWSTYSRQGLEQSVTLFQQAIQADPRFAPAWAGFADASVRLADMSSQESAARMADARRAAAKAISLDDSNAEAHGVLGRICLFKDWDFQGAAHESQRSVALDPLRVSSHVNYSQALTILGDMRGAEGAILAAKAHFPPLPDLLLQEGSIYFLSRKFEKTEAIGRELIALSPASAAGHWLVGVALERRGNVPQAIAEFKSGLQQAAKDDLRTLCALSHSYAMAKDNAHAMETVHSYYRPGEQSVSRFTVPYCVALTYAGMNQKEMALEWLEKARASKDASFPFFPYDIRFDPLKSDARYARLAETLKHAAIPAGVNKSTE